jgi:TPR repeat protein
MPDKQIIINPSKINDSLYEFSQIIQNSDKINIKEIEPTIKNINKNIFEGDLINVIDELVNLILKELNEGKDEELTKRNILNCINNHDIISQEIYIWLLNNQNNSNSIYLLGYFNYHGIEININKQKAFKLYQKASELKNNIAQLNLAILYMDGPDAYKYSDEIFELAKKFEEKEYASGINILGHCYSWGIGTNMDLKKAFELFQKAANLGNLIGMCNLGLCYKEGLGTDKNGQKAFEIYQKAAELGNSRAINSLADYYQNGIHTDINKQKAFELYQKAANLGNYFAQYELALMYEIGDEIKKDLDKAVYWYKKSAEQGHTYAQNKLKECLKNVI